METAVTVVILRVLLVTVILGMALLAVDFLRRRKLDWWEVLAWGLLALAVPVVGPFVVIACRPGRRRRFPQMVREIKSL